MPNTTLDRGFTSTGGKPVNRSFAEKLALANDEDSKVKPIYEYALSKGLKKENAGIDIDTARLDKYADGLYDCWYYTDNGSEVPFLLQIECKRQVDLNDSEQFAAVMLQVFYYIKQFEKSGMAIPKVVVLGTQINCLAIATSDFYSSYIEKQYYPTDVSASQAARSPLYQPLLRRIRDDAALQTKRHIIEVTDKNAVSELCKDIVKLAKDIGLTEEITSKQIVRAYDFFNLKVLTEKSRKELDPRDKVAAFMQLLLNPDKVASDAKVNALGKTVFSGSMNFNGIRAEIYEDKFNAFGVCFAIKNREAYEQEDLTAVQDQIIEDETRSRNGDYYTPSIWVDEAHKLMDKNLGPNWRKESIVWDCAWGTGNLTRGYKDFEHLYCSTLYEEDIKTGQKYNPFAAKFQYDFLNDDVNLFQIVLDTLWSPFAGTRFYGSSLIKDKMNFRDVSDIYAQAVEANVTTEEKCQQAMQKAVELLHQSKLHLLGRNSAAGTVGNSLIDELLESSQACENGRPLVFFINPPYKAAGSGHGNENMSGATYSETADAMKYNGVSGSGQLYSQFLYRIHTIATLFGIKITVGVFSPSQVLNSVQVKDVRSLLLERGYLGGFMLQASNFADVANNWGISFTLWGDTDNKYTAVDVMEIADTETDVTVSVIQHNKPIRMLEKDEKALYWIKDKASKNVESIPRFTSAINYDTSRGYEREKGSLATMIMDMGIVESNLQRVAIMPSRTNANWSIIDITKSNFDRAVSFFTARKLIIPTWINCKDEYMIPNTEHPDYAQWQADCIVHSLFNTASNQSSLRSIEYNGKTLNIFNEFFWMSREDIYELATGAKRQDTLAPAVADDVLKYGQSGNRFVYEKLQTVHLSDDAKLVLDMATAILIDTMKYREEFDRKHPEYHINSWDAGWYQVKAVAKEYIPDKLKLFNELYKKLEDRMRPLVYELGFLYK